MLFFLLLQSDAVTKNSKSQISNNKQITMTKIQNSKPVLVIEYWNLRFVCNLVLGAWDFIDSSTPKQHAIFSIALVW
jgi:hypothetical protein